MKRTIRATNVVTWATVQTYKDGIHCSENCPNLYFGDGECWFFGALDYRQCPKLRIYKRHEKCLQAEQSQSEQTT
jgi:hypothetical protein